MATNKANWEQQILKQIEENRKVTFLGAAHPQLSPEQHPNFKVYEFTPNKSLDGDERYLLAGPEWSIMQQSSMLKANHDMLGNRFGFTLDFELWFSYFEYEFLNAIPPRKCPPKNNWKPWGKDVKQRPKKLNLTDKKEAAKTGLMVIQFWPDRSMEDDSVRMGGTYMELKQQMYALMRQSSVQSETYAVPTTVYQEDNKFEVQVVLLFLEDSKDIKGNHSPMMGRVAFKVLGETSETITEAKAKTLANKINSELGANNGYVYRKGKVHCSYSNQESDVRN